jgi:hypothetical protein
MEFQPFPKIARWSREITITEKIDGTNASVYIGPGDPDDPAVLVASCAAPGDPFIVMKAGSRTRWITPADDNFGFARWAKAHEEELFGLGQGHHFGEWWGAGIQRKYGLSEKRWSLFNSGRWCAHDAEPAVFATADPRVSRSQERAPECCHVVPTLYRGPNNPGVVDVSLEKLSRLGSEAALAFPNPEGVIIWHEAARVAFKKTLEGDAAPKGKG